MLWGLRFAAASLDLITCRAAAHHFRDFAAALDEARRALRPGGSLVMADSIAPEDDAVAEWMNDIELRRDFSHIKNRKISVIRQMKGDLLLSVYSNTSDRPLFQFPGHIPELVL